MNHPDAEDLTRTLRGPRTLLEMCLDLRMAHDGSADPISDEDTAAALAYLNYRLATWKPSILPSGARFDECVRALVLATIVEVQCRQMERARILGLPEIQSPITDAAIDAARWGLLGQYVRATHSPEHDHLFPGYAERRAALSGAVAKVDARDAAGAYHVTTDDETQWAWYQPDELAPVAKTDPLAGLPEAERARIIAAAEKAQADRDNPWRTPSTDHPQTCPYRRDALNVCTCSGVYRDTIAREVAAYRAGRTPEMLNREEAEARLRALGIGPKTISEDFANPRDVIACYDPANIAPRYAAEVARRIAILAAHVRWLDAQKSAEARAPRIAPREVRYEAVMRRSAEIDAAAEREPK